MLEYWSFAPCPNCTPLRRGWDCFQGTSLTNTEPRVKFLGLVLVALLRGANRSINGLALC